MKEDDIKILEKQTETVLAQWWCELNRWEWPEGLPEPMTEKERNSPYTGKDRDSQIMNWIDEAVGHKKLNRHWNKDRMTDEEHEAFWRKNFKSYKAMK